jgi:ABC-type Fe3+/spermidine/putrescine transport system ATPase subunit
VPSKMLSVRGLSFRFDRDPVLCDISLELRRGQCLAVLGPSGCGKSTLLSCIAGFHEPTQGTIELDGVDVTGWPPEVRNLGVVFQEYALFPHMTVFENIAFGLRARRERSGVIQARVDELIEVVGLHGMTRRYPSQLSGGQRQRVALARALAPHPRLLLLDEPLTALDRALRAQLQDELRRLHQRLGLTIILVTHDPEEAMSLADTILLLQHGRILQSGPTKALYDDPVSPEAMTFLGRVTEFSGRLVRQTGREVTIEFPESKIRLDLTPGRDWSAVNSGDDIRLLVRPERVQLFPLTCQPALKAAHADDMALMIGRVTDVVEKGSILDVRIALNDSPTLIAVIPAESGREYLSVGHEVLVGVPTAAIRCFPSA